LLTAQRGLLCHFEGGHHWSLNPGFGKRSIAYAHKGAYGRAISDWSHWQWIKYGFIGIATRLFVLVLTIGFGFWLKRFQQQANVQ